MSYKTAKYNEPKFSRLKLMLAKGMVYFNAALAGTLGAVAIGSPIYASLDNNKTSTLSNKRVVNVIKDQSELEHLISDYMNRIDQEIWFRYIELNDHIKELFNKAIADGKLSVKEQGRIYWKLAEAKELIDMYMKERESAQIKGQNNKKSSRGLNAVLDKIFNYNLYEGLEQNLYGADFGVPELEKYLKEKGYDIRVERCHTKEDNRKIWQDIEAMIVSTIIILPYLLLTRGMSKRENLENKKNH